MNLSSGTTHSDRGREKVVERGRGTRRERESGGERHGEREGERESVRERDSARE